MATLTRKDNKTVVTILDTKQVAALVKEHEEREKEREAQEQQKQQQQRT